MAATEARGRGILLGMQVLETLAGMEQPTALDDIARACGLTRTRAYRALRDLEAEGYVDHVGGRSGYRVGTRSLALAALLGPRPVVIRRTRPVLARLAEIAREPATLHLRSGRQRVLVMAETSPPGTLGIPMGERAPLTSGCSGKSILAYLPEAEFGRIVAGLPPEKAAGLRADARQIRADRYAISYSSNHRNLSGIAAPVLDPEDGCPLGSIAVAGAEARLTESVLRRLVTPLLAACDGLGPQLAALIGRGAPVRHRALDVTIRQLLEE